VRDNESQSWTPSALRISPEEYGLLDKHFLPLYDDFRKKDSYPDKRPLLAHYTSISTLERIVATDEIWFSNPLFMDDLEELRFGITEGSQQVLNSDAVKKACGTAQRAKILFDAFNHYLSTFSNEHALDVYILCWSEHERENTDGLLSMWRGYGGNGKGVALTSPLILAQVKYGSTQDRSNSVSRIVERFAALLENASLRDDRLHIAAWLIFQRIKLFAIYTKHRGFSEEREWRIAYFQERDQSKVLNQMLGYAIGNRGVEPKLKFKVAPLAGVTAPDLSLEKITHQVILGPSISTRLAQGAVLRMLEKNGKNGLKDRVIASSIPFRAV
jgi:hypothetical protein